jgi:hypothetical protein
MVIKTSEKIYEEMTMIMIRITRKNEEKQDAEILVIELRYGRRK